MFTIYYMACCKSNLVNQREVDFWWSSAWGRGVWNEQQHHNSFYYLTWYIPKVPQRQHCSLAVISYGPFHPNRSTIIRLWPQWPEILTCTVLRKVLRLSWYPVVVRDDSRWLVLRSNSSLLLLYNQLQDKALGWLGGSTARMPRTPYGTISLFYYKHILPER